MRRYTVLTIATSGLMLLVVGVATNTMTLFYMSTVMLLMLVTMRLQAILATKGLRFERIAPGTIVAGELITMRIRVWSSIRLRRPLLVITDNLPPTLLHQADMRPLPVAPDFEQAVETRYELRPMKRGKYRWSSIRVQSTDSLGIISVEKTYPTDPMEFTVYPAQIPFGLDLVALSGWGANQADQGRNRGPGLEPRGVREFRSGDSLRYVHWRTTARRGEMQVKEFETGFNTNLVLLIQQTSGSEAGKGAYTTLEAMCGHAAYLADIMLQRGSPIVLPNLEPVDFDRANSAGIRYEQVADALASAEANRTEPFAFEVDSLVDQLEPSSTVVLMVAAAEPGLGDAIRRLSAVASVVVLIYNPDQFPGNSIGKGFRPATDPDFLAKIATPTVAIRLMQNPYASDTKAA
ncbi:MAG: DUF58 domain-containing protein [Fimbriimonadales bacterium]|nr:DUF58 domain-containing protein [Fimbriimonadales bacterium]